MTRNNDENQQPVERVEPVNAEAEQQVLGILLYDHTYLERIAQTLRAEHFAYPEHQAIYGAILAMAQDGEIADPVTLGAYMANSGELSLIGNTAVSPQAYIGGLVANIVSVTAIRSYAKAVRDAYGRRQLIKIAADLTADAYDARLDLDPAAMIRQAETDLYQLAEREQSAGRVMTAGEAARLQVAETEQAFKNGEPANILRTRLLDLDRALGGGIGPGEFVVLAARPSMGKTALAQEIAERVANQKIPVAIISLEMRAQALMARRLAAHTGISTVRQRMGNPISMADVGAMVEASNWLDSLPIFIDDKPGRTVVEICLAARHLIKRHGIGLLIIDHLQIIRQDAKLIGKATEDMSQTTAALHILAADTGVPVLALSQLSRGVEGRDDKRPDLADLRQSGTIEQDADVVAFLYREEYYLRRAEPKRKPGETDDAIATRTQHWEEAIRKCTGRADILLRKHRNARCPNDIALAWNGERQRFGDYLNPDHPHHHQDD